MQFTEFDREMMRRALELARSGIGYVSPNPLVGCVITGESGEILGEGAHLVYGGPHAEPNAIRDAESKGHSVAGATVYVTLEPHCHEGKTHPCSKLLIEKDISRCVIAMEDPNSAVSGNGILQMREAGIGVEVGLLEDEARELNRFFIKFVTTGRPYVTLKIASSLDGRVALSNGESKWVTSEASRTNVHQMRAEYDAVLVGSRTALLDDPELTVRLVKGRQPFRIVLDSRMDLPDTLRLFSDEHKAKTIVITKSMALEGNSEKRELFESRGISIIAIDDASERIDINSALNVLGSRGIASVLAECGPTLAASMVRENLFDEMVMFFAPIFLGADAMTSIGHLDVASIPGVARLALNRLERVVGSDDILIHLRPGA